MRFCILFVLTISSLLLARPAQAQRRGKATVAASADGSLPAATATPKPARLQPMFGGLTPAQASALLAPGQLDAIARSFASRAEASTFLATKGYEYLAENQPDTAAYRFNLAWLLNPLNADAYHGLGILASQESTPDHAIKLLGQGLALAPTNAGLLADLGSSHLIRYEQNKKKKDLQAAAEYLQRATAAEPNSAETWQSLARVYFFQEKYPQAWEAVHKGRNLSMGSLDFTFLSELIARQPDPQGVFK